MPKLPSPVDTEADDAKTLAQVRDFYATTLQASPEALAYLESRGLKQPSLIEHFKLGFSNRTLGLRLPANNRDAGAKLRGRLQHLGVMRESGHEHLTGSLVVPIHDEAGAVVGMYGRKVTKGLRPGTASHLYLPGPHRAAFNSAALAGQSVAIVCEALHRRAHLLGAGHRNVIAAYGVEGFTPHHLEALKRHGVDDVLIAYDRDDAGDAAAEVLAKRLLAESFNCYRVKFPWGMDANEYALKVPPAAKSLGTLLRAAAWMGSGTAPGAPNLSSLAAVEPPAAPTHEGEKRAPVTVLCAGRRGRHHREWRRARRLDDGRPRARGGLRADRSAITAPSARGTASRARSAEPQRPLAPRAPEVVTEVKEEEVVFLFGPRRYRVRGLGEGAVGRSAEGEHPRRRRRRLPRRHPRHVLGAPARGLPQGRGRRAAHARGDAQAGPRPAAAQARGAAGRGTQGEAGPEEDGAHAERATRRRRRSSC